MKSLQLFRKRRLQEQRNRAQNDTVTPTQKPRQAKPKSYLEDEDISLFI
ncbi:hypothetical protein [Winogradskyella aurantia]|nr:hypothetical protein [Winogradskyella aurantia]